MGTLANIDDDQIMGTVRELADAVSTQARVSNRTWLTLMTVALVALFRQTLQETANLPYLGEVNANAFFVIAFLMLVVLTIAFTTAHAQQVRAQKLAQAAVDSLGFRHTLGIHPRDLFDMLRTPSVIRVAPLAQSLRGKYQFYAERDACPRPLRFASTAYYILLKGASLLVYFILPAVALWYAHMRIQVTGIPGWVLTGAGAIASLSLLQVFVVDVMYMIKVSGVIWRGGTAVGRHRGDTV